MCPDRDVRLPRRLVALVAGVGLAGALSACGPSGPAPMRADETTALLASVEAERQCAIAAQSFPGESDITADLEQRLADAGVTYAQWKDWHDALATSPELVEQVEALGDTCPGA